MRHVEKRIRGLVGSEEQLERPDPGDPPRARLEGVLTDPVGDGGGTGLKSGTDAALRSMAELIDLVRDGRIAPGSKVWYAHLGGQPALNGYAGAFA